MNKKIIITVSFLIILVIIAIGFIYTQSSIVDKNITISPTESNIGTTETKISQEIAKETVQDKIKKIKKKLALKGLISSGNENIQEQEYTLALTKYLKIYSELPTDPVVINKLGEIYFSLHKYSQSYRYFQKILHSKKLNTDLAAEALLLSQDIDINNIDQIKLEIDKLIVDEKKNFYYTTVLLCYSDYNLCKETFSNDITKISGTGALVPQLKNIQDALVNYKNFQTDDTNYQDALLAAAFFQNGSYAISLEVGKNILKQQADYKPILKLLAKINYEIGDWKQTKLYLSSLNKLDNQDPEVSYFLGIVQEKLHEYLLSIIHFQKALKSGASNTLDIRKRLIYSYYELDQIEKMLETLRDMADKNTDELTQDDFSFIIYHHIDQGDIKNAKKYSLLAQELYPDSVVISSYIAWVLSNELQIEASTLKAEEIINKLFIIEPNNPLVLLVKGNIALNTNDLNLAFIYLKKAIASDKNGEFINKSKELLEKVAEKKKQAKIIGNALKK